MSTPEWDPEVLGDQRAHQIHYPGIPDYRVKTAHTVFSVYACMGPGVTDGPSLYTLCPHSVLVTETLTPCDNIPFDTPLLQNSLITLGRRVRSRRSGFLSTCTSTQALLPLPLVTLPNKKLCAAVPREPVGLQAAGMISVLKSNGQSPEPIPWQPRLLPAIRNSPR